MALANVAWVLAASGRRVLMIDWDLEAPGLHRYVRPFLIDEELAASDGLIDLVDNYANHAIRPLDPHAKPDANWFLEYTDFADYIVSVNFDGFPSGGKIDFLPAGRQNDRYAITVNSFNWQNFYDRLGGGGFFEAVKARAREQYDYILIDSRTGVSDTAGICSVQMPDLLVVCFTYNNQSIKGAAAVARSAVAARQKLADESRAAPLAASSTGAGRAVTDTAPSFRVFPVPMRVDPNESDRLLLRQTFARRAFGEFVGHLQPSALTEYWTAVEIPHRAFYAYEEVLSTFKDVAHDPKSVLAAFVRLASYVSDRDVGEYRSALTPEDRQRWLDKFAETPITVETKRTSETPPESEEEALVRTADHALGTLDEPGRAAARLVFERLVRLGRDEEGGGFFPIRASLNDFSDDQIAVIQALADRGLLTVVSDRSPRPSGRSPTPSADAGAERTVGLRDDRLLKTWPVLLRWLDEDHEFLLWRQQMRAYLSDWERGGRERGALLSGPLLGEADHWRLRRASALNEAETAFIKDSRAASEAIAAPGPIAHPAQAGPTGAPTFGMPRSAPTRSRTIGVVITALVVGAISLALVWFLARSRSAPTPSSGSTDQASTGTPNPTDRPSIVPAAAPPAVDSLIAQGDGYYAAGNVERARDAYLRALQLNPKSGLASAALGRVLAGDLSTSGRVALHYADASDQPVVEQVNAALTEALTGLTVDRPERAAARTAGDVRYFYPADEKLAQRVKRATETALGKQNISVSLTLLSRSAKAFPTAQAGTIEVWLPSLTARRPASAR